MYIHKQRRKRFNFGLNESEREQINFIMEYEEIPDTAKAIRYCISEKYEELRELRNKEK